MLRATPRAIPSCRSGSAADSPMAATQFDGNASRTRNAARDESTPPENATTLRPLAVPASRVRATSSSRRAGGTGGRRGSSGGRREEDTQGRLEEEEEDDEEDEEDRVARWRVQSSGRLRSSREGSCGIDVNSDCGPRNQWVCDLNASHHHT